MVLPRDRRPSHLCTIMKSLVLPALLSHLRLSELLLAAVIVKWQSALVVAGSSESASTPTAGRALPYIAYRTFRSGVERLAVAGQLPSQIDRSVLTSMPGGTQGHFLAALRALSLVDGDSTPTAELRRLIEDWEQSLAGVVRAQYPAGALDQLARGTPASLVESLGTGSKGTRTRAALFLVSAAQDAAIDVSPHMLDKNGKPKGFGRRGRIRQKKPTPVEAGGSRGESTTRSATADGRESQRIQLGRGRMATLDWPADIDGDEIAALFQALDAYRGFLEHQARARADQTEEEGGS